MKNFLILVLILSIVHITVGQGVPYGNAQQLYAGIEQKYGFDQSSSYPQLLTALQKANQDFEQNLKSGANTGIPILAMDRICSSVKPENRIQLGNDFFLQQPDLSSKGAGVHGVLDALDKGLSAPASVTQDLANRIYQALQGLPPDSVEKRQFIQAGIDALVRLLDDRGLDAMLTNKQYMKTLQNTNKWDAYSPTSTFTTLKQQYQALNGQHAGDRLYAAFYELCERRKNAGAATIVPISPVVDLSKW